MKTSQSDSKVALVMLLGYASGDPRPRRFIDLLINQGYTVDIVSYLPKTQLPVRNIFEIKKPQTRLELLKFRVFSYLKRILSVFGAVGFINDMLNNLVFGLIGLGKTIKEYKYNLIVVEDIFFLPLATKHRNDARIIFDAREYYPLQNEERFLWRKLEQPDRIRLCRTYLQKCDYVITVSPGLAKRYDAEFGTKCIVLRSVPFYKERPVRPTKIDKIKIVHHGIANPNRKLEQMIDVVKRLDDRFSFDMYLAGSQSYIDSLKIHAESISAVRILDPVPYHDLDAMLASGYDIGFFYNDPTTFNLRHSLPNKLFEFIQARLAVAIGPSPDMSEIVSEFGCGVIASEFSVELMAESLNRLTSDDIDTMKKNADAAARILNYELESLRFLEILKKIEKYG